MLDHLLQKQVRLIVGDYVIVGVLTKKDDKFIVINNQESHPFSSDSIHRVKNKVILLK